MSKGLNMSMYKSIIAAVQQGNTKPKQVIKATGIPGSTAWSRLATLKRAKVLILKKGEYSVATEHVLSNEEIEQLQTRAEIPDGANPELRRIEQKLLGLVDEVRALSASIVTPKERATIEALRKAGVRIKV